MLEQNQTSKGFKQYDFCGQSVIAFQKSEYNAPFSIVKTEGDHNLENCEGCKKIHASIIERHKLKNNFPNCCEYHKKLPDLKEFQLEHFANFPLEIANKVIYSHHHIINNIENIDWETEIFDYLDYVIESFGTMPKGYGAPNQLNDYVLMLVDIINSITDVVLDNITENEYKSRINTITEKLNITISPENEVFEAFGLLLKSYEEWYNLFPFELDYFKHLEKKFQNTIPFHQNKTTYNKYLKKETYHLHTLESLSSELIEITTQILITINGKVLFDEGKLKNTEEIKLSLLLKNREFELESMKKMSNKNKLEYIKILKKWISEEKQFITEITPYLQPEEKQPLTTRANRTDIAYFVHYTSNSNELKLDNLFPSVKAWAEIGTKYNRNSKNIQQMYNTIVNNETERLKKTKKKNIEFVIQNMLDNYPLAKKQAEFELKQLNLNP